MNGTVFDREAVQQAVPNAEDYEHRLACIVPIQYRMFRASTP